MKQMLMGIIIGNSGNGNTNIILRALITVGHLSFQNDAIVFTFSENKKYIRPDAA